VQDHSIKQYYKSALLFVGIVGIAFLCLELVSYFYFKNKELANTPSPDEVSTSNTAGQILNTSTTSLETFKVATFGSSETQGYGSVRNYSALLKHELEKVFPSKSVIVDTHVLEEKTFSTHQYKKVISLVKDYDLLVVSAVIQS
jgi:CO dehydrogenase nickel-insertion accessory protein CooC1